jgi:hypothetical protein
MEHHPGGGPLHVENRRQLPIRRPHPEGCFPGIRAGRARAAGGLALTGVPLLRAAMIRMLSGSQNEL